MITGDNPLTACHVAKELNLTRKTTLVLTAHHSDMQGWYKLYFSLFLYFAAILEESS